ncbi:MAG: competence/damage-inducible protein A [Gammaproteobacteria bacterium]|nr:MAG: competence/damage-inducible protein A [Gammaproteobacteria bacterium]
MTDAALIVIGNEILSGRTRDASLPYIGRRCDELGISLLETRIVPDLEEAIVEAVNTCRARYRHVFTTGGIGPTHDDITTRSIAAAFGVPVVRHPGAEARLREYYGDGRLNEARLRMAEIPRGAELIDNPVSGAPGFRMENVYVMAGVPVIMKAMFESIAGRLEGGPPLLSRTVVTRHAESRLAPGLAAIQERFPAVSIGSYPFFRMGSMGVRVVLRGTDATLLDQAEREVREMLGCLDRERP